MRLTKKDVIDTISNGQSMFVLERTIGKTLTNRLLSEMLEYKDIEKELGIELVILFNALRNGVYYRMYSGQITKDYVFLISNNMGIGQVSKLDYSFMTCFEKNTLLFDDYGKSWALTEEELL